jgi:hypothetical protein
MKHTRYFWFAFAVSLLLLVSVMGWLSSTLLRLKQSETASRQQTELGEKVQLDLLQLD